MNEDKVERAELTSRLVFAMNKILGMSQEAIATAVGVSFTTVNAWANSKRQPHPSAYADLRAAFDREIESRRAASGEAKVRAIVAILHATYGSPDLSNKKDPLDELFFILLSLKTSHLTYEDTYRVFQEQFHPWSKLLEARHEEVEKYIRRGGLGSMKARSFIEIARRLQADFGSVTLAPVKEMSAEDAEKYLTSLPGVGLKTARCVMMYSLGADVTPVDTHTYRVGVRLGLVPTSTSTSNVHSNFDRIVPKGLAYSMHTNFVVLGREHCDDPTPRCDGCPAEQFCSYAASRVEVEPVDLSQLAQKEYRRRSLLPPKGRVLRAVDLYAGCGGLSAGVRDAGLNLVYALDWDKHACATHEANFPESAVECEDVRNVTGSRIEKLAGGKIDIVVGGPNCQGVSERGLRNPDDPRNFMFPEYVRLISELNPTAFIMENVPGLVHRHNFELLRTIFASFARLGYKCAGDVLLAANYGVPQLRYRFFLIGTRADVPLTLPAPTHASSPEAGLFLSPFVSVWDAIGDLPAIEADTQKERELLYATEPQTDFQRYAREGVEMVRNHVCSATDEINLRRAAFVPEGGNWKDIPSDLLPGRFFGCRMTDHSTTYARLRRDQPAFTITSLFGNITSGAFTHPLSNRALSIREGARLQSFRDSFVFRGPRNSQYRQIGNAVPPLLGRAVASHLSELLTGERPAGIEPRVTDAVLRSEGAWESLPVLTPRFKQLFGQGTRWPKGWGNEPDDWSTMLDKNYSLRAEFWPEHVRMHRRRRADTA